MDSMSIANLCPQKQWNDWKREMEENRRKRLWERIRRWVKVEASDEEEEDSVDEEGEDTDSCEEDGSEEDNEPVEKGEEEEVVEVKEAEEFEEVEVEGESSQKKGLKKNNGDEEEDWEMSDVSGRTGVEEEEVKKEVKENEDSVEDEEKEVKEEGENKKWEEEREDEVESGVEDKEEVVEEEEWELKEAEEYKEEEVKREGDLEKELEENIQGDEKDTEMDEADERVDMEEEEEKEENEEEREVQKNKQVDDGEEIVVKEAGEVKKVEQQEGDEVDRWVKEKEDEEKEWEAIETNEFEEFEGESCQEEGLSKNKKGDKQMTEADESVDVAEEKGQEDNEIEREVKENEEVDEEEEWEMKEAKEMDGERENKVKREIGESEKDEELQEQEQSGRYHLEEQVTEQIPVDNIQQNQESAAHENDTVNDSVELMNEDSENEFHNLERLKVEDQYAEKQHEDSDKLEDPGEKSWRSENEVFGVWTTQERNKEDESEKLTDEEGTATESWTSQEEFQYYLKSLQEEDSKDEEEAAHSMDEDGEGSDEDEVKDYSKDDYPTDIFLALNEFRESSLLTDLTLSTDDGKTFQVHSPVLAAVSSLIWKHLNRRKVENMRAHERQDDDTNAGAQRWSVYLGPEVDHVGLETIVEFAYTGLISSLNEDNVDQIRAAAQALGVRRVLNLCTQQEEESTKTGGQKKKERTSAAQEMMISLESIKQLWMDRVGCDVILEALGASLHVHRVILAVSSDYFRGMFTLGMKESHQPSVTLPLLLASELEALIDCSYSGALPLSWRCVFELTSTALQLQYQPALSLCLNFLHQEITPDSCLDVISFAEAYGMTQLLEVADDFVLRQFQKVACTSKFKDLPARQLLKYLNSCSLCVPSELVVFKAVAAWIQAKPRIRSRLAKDLMKTIHFPLMTFKEFKEVQSQNMWSDHNLSELYKAIFEDFCSTEPAMENKCRIYLPKESLVLIGGDQITEDLVRRNISRELWFGNSLRNHTGVKKAMEWRKLGEMPEPERFRHEVAVLKGQLYVFGGKMYYGINDTLSSVYRYDPLQNSWESLADMQEKRCSFSAVVLDGNIYTIGGHCHPDYIDSVERYCATTNTWSFTWPLDLPLSGHVAKVAQGRIFVSGGQNSDYLCLASMFLYHPETGSTYLANMPKPRAHHCMETLGERLYVAGGVTTADNMTVVDQLACEVYSPAEDSWTAFTSLSVPHVGAASAVLEGKFYVLGGYSQEDFSDTKMVHRYDRATWRWENMGKMPGPNSDIRASVLCLPQHFRM